VSTSGLADESSVPSEPVVGCGVPGYAGSIREFLLEYRMPFVAAGRDCGLVLDPLIGGHT
jgi:hypothetical protein